MSNETVIEQLRKLNKDLNITFFTYTGENGVIQKREVVSVEQAIEKAYDCNAYDVPYDFQFINDKTVLGGLPIVYPYNELVLTPSEKAFIEQSPTLMAIIAIMFPITAAGLKPVRDILPLCMYLSGTFDRNLRESLNATSDKVSYNKMELWENRAKVIAAVVSSIAEKDPVFKTWDEEIAEIICGLADICSKHPSHFVKGAAPVIARTEYYSQWVGTKHNVLDEEIPF